MLLVLYAMFQICPGNILGVPPIVVFALFPWETQ